MPTFLLGKDAKIYQGPAGTALSAMTLMDNIRDLMLNLEAGEADVTTRGNSGWRGTAQTVRECSVEFEMLWKPGDAGFDAVKAAYMSGSTIEFAVLDRDRASQSPPAEGMKAAFSITAFSRSESLEGVMTVAVTAKLTVFSQWVPA